MKFSDFRILFHPAVLVVSAGYFVDILDLTLFNMVRVASLSELGFAPDEMVARGMLLLNLQMFGMLLGGFFWGQLADKQGRMRSLFASIILYSLANIGNAFVNDFYSYGFLRFISGFGLAGELGVGITLVSEILPARSRGLGTAFIATFGVLGAVLGGVLVEFFSWRICFGIGGVAGLLLLFARYKTSESYLFDDLAHRSDVRRGRLLDLFSDWTRVSRFFYCVLIGVPIWFIAGIVMPYIPEIGVELGVADPLLSSRAIAISYLGLGFGDFLSGVTSQLFSSRRKAVFLFQGILFITLFYLFFTASGKSDFYIYTLCFLIGVGAGFWALFVTIGAEAFGTNLRATAATSIPNIVRASVIPMSLFVHFLRNSFSLTVSASIVGVIAACLGLLGTYMVKETFGVSLKFLEEKT